MIITFICGALGEFAWLLWIYCASQAWPWAAACAAMSIGAFSAFGIRESIKSRRGMVGLILGYGVGSFAAAYLKGLL